MAKEKQGPLKNLKVLDFTRIYSGPYCTMLLADLGAEIIKVEIPKTGDDSRSFLPFKNNASGYYLYLNRNKKGITLNLKSPEGKAIALKLAKWADVVVENFSPGTMQRLGLDYDSICKVNPQIVYASISGFGQTGPLRKKVAYDSIVQAMSGLMGITGYPDRPPVKAGSSIADANAGIHAAFGIMTALYYRQQTGKGQYVDVSMMDSAFSILENYVIKYTMTGINPQRTGNENVGSAPVDIFPTKDDYVMIATSNNKLFKKLAHVMNREELPNDPRFVTNELRKRNYSQLRPIIIEWTTQHTTEEIVGIFDQVQIPGAPILSIKQVVEHPQIKARNMLVEIEDPVVGKVSIPGFPIKFSATPGAVEDPAPLLGQHTDEVLSTILGFTNDEIEALRNKNVL